MKKNYNAWPAPILLMILCSACNVIVLGQGGTGRETPTTPPKTAPARKKAPASRPPSSPTRTKKSVSQKSLYEKWRQNFRTDYKVAYEAAQEYVRRFPNDKSQNAQDLKIWVTAYEKVSSGSAPQQTSDQPKADDAAANERTYWETIRLSTDPKAFKTYLEKYPNGPFSGLARDNLTRLETAPKAPLKRDSAGRIILGSISGSNTEATKPPPKPGSIVRNQIGMELVYVPAGSFMMGSNNGEPIEKPVHEVKIKEGFYMGRYEVTQAEWQQVMGNNPSHLKNDRKPVGLVSWDDAQSFISKLNERGDGFKYRLPSEAEWEYACRAGTTGDYAGEVNEMGWFTDNSGGRTHVGGEKRPNAFGLYDMHGNVFEWCSDSYHGNYAGAPVDGSAWLSGKQQDHRMFRGGSFGNRAALLRSAARVGYRQSGSSSSIGFRIAALMLTR